MTTAVRPMRQEGRTTPMRPRPKNKLRAALRLIVEAEKSLTHEERVFLESARTLIEDVLNRKPGAPMPGLHEPKEATR